MSPSDRRPSRLRPARCLMSRCPRKLSRASDEIAREIVCPTPRIGSVRNTEFLALVHFRWWGSVRNSALTHFRWCLACRTPRPRRGPGQHETCVMQRIPWSGRFSRACRRCGSSTSRMPATRSWCTDRPRAGPWPAVVRDAHEQRACIPRASADIPVDGRSVVLRVRVRRMRCRATANPRKTFREQVPGLLERYRRRTTRLTEQLRAIVAELAGRAAARLAPPVGITAARTNHRDPHPTGHHPA